MKPLKKRKDGWVSYYYNHELGDKVNELIKKVMALEKLYLKLKNAKLSH